MACELTDFFVLLQLLLLSNVTIQACDPPCLYLSAGGVIKSIELSSKKITSNVTEPQAHDGRVLALAVDVEEKTLYFSDQVSRTIRRIDLKSSKIEDVASEVGHCEGMAIDWVNKYIYWTDNQNDRIEMSRVDGSDRKLLFDRDVQYLRGISVDPVHGYMFWTDYADNPKIERATLAGQERTTIIANAITVTRLKYPNDVIVDYTSNRIYWVDAGLNVIGTADLNGRNIKVSEPIKNSHLFSLALYNNTLYNTDSEMNAKSIIVVDKESLGEVHRFTQAIIGSRDLFGLIMLHESRQPPVISPCSHGNGGCSHLCFIVPDGYRCGCPNGTALREDGYSCQEANFTNCRNLPCQNGGTCYFNFQRFADDCTCGKYYVEKDCGLYLGAGAVGVTLEMNVEEWEKEKFKEAIMGGLNDYCNRDNCGLRNESISKQFCPCFLNNSARLDATQVIVIGQPVASLPNHTKVDFAVILRPVSSSKPLVVVNTTLEHIIWERANSNKHLKIIVLVNNRHPSSETRCSDVKSKEKEEKRKSKNNAITIAIAIGTSFAVILLVTVSVVVAVWCRRKQHIRANQLRDNEGENDDRYEEVVPPAEETQNQPRDNNGEGNNGRDDFDLREDQRDNNRQGNDGRYEEQRGDQRRGNNGEGSNDRNRILINKNFNKRRGSFVGVNLDIVDNRKIDNLGGQRSATGNEDMSFPQGWPLLQETSIGAKENLNSPGNQHRENYNERDCEVTHEYEVAHENGSLQLDEASEDTNASQALATSATARHPIENDDDVVGTYTNPVQCTDDIKKNPH